MSAPKMNGGTPATQEEPAPVPGRIDVWPLVIADVVAREWLALGVDMAERNAEGTRKYGTPLQTHNGRRAVVDAYQESLDQVVYLRQAIAETGYDLPADPGKLRVLPEAFEHVQGLVFAYFDALNLCRRLRDLAVGGAA